MSSGNPQLHVRSGPAAQPPDEQLLPASNALPVLPFDHKAYPQKYSAVYVPLSLAIGVLRTSEFTISKRSEWYDLMLQFEKPLPLQQMQCMTGTTSGPLDEQLCKKDDPILGADWTVWLEGRIVQWGSIPKGCGCILQLKSSSNRLAPFHWRKAELISCRFI